MGPLSVEKEMRAPFSGQKDGPNERELHEVALEESTFSKKKREGKKPLRSEVDSSSYDLNWGGCGSSSHRVKVKHSTFLQNRG